MMAFWRPNMPMVWRDFHGMAIRGLWQQLRAWIYFHLLKIQRGFDVITAVVSIVAVVSILWGSPPPQRGRHSPQVDTSDHASGADELTAYQIKEAQEAIEKGIARQDSALSEIRALRSDVNGLIESQKEFRQQAAASKATFMKLLGLILTGLGTLIYLAIQSAITRWQNKKVVGG